MIQIWSLDSSTPSDLSRATVEGARGASMMLEMSLCVTIGDALDIQWCPRGGDDPTTSGANLGLLAGTFTDGSLSLFVVPDPLKFESEEISAPGCLHRSWHFDRRVLTLTDSILLVRSEATLRLVLDNTSMTCFTWISYEMIIAGCTNGKYFIFKLIVLHGLDFCHIFRLDCCVAYWPCSERRC